jgi:hypothetical protein
MVHSRPDMVGKLQHRRIFAHVLMRLVCRSYKGRDSVGVKLEKWHDIC